MARVYMVTEAEMQSLLDQIQLHEMRRNGITIHPEERLSPDEMNRLSQVHLGFHMVCVRWAHEMGFRGVRFTEPS